ncbi:MAG TPA: PIN domain-containing protein [Caldimonas sp.]|jgi:predicted nucleic acid-binding protein|nr:PIN domain-containing protein [Caldimonas sp.]HEX2542476.1 PIN domain-containing protein [Caldimonas sp.]
MAGHVRYTALLDACVLYPVTVADVLMSLARTGLFAAKWSIEIESEWLTNVAKANEHLKLDRLERRRALMRLAVPDWEVPQRKYSPLVPAIVLPDANDRHVLAAAIAGHADCIVSANTRDFPEEALSVHDIELIHPDDFVIMQWDMDPLVALQALKTMRTRFKAPPLTAEEFADRLERSGLYVTAERIREAGGLI